MTLITNIQNKTKDFSLTFFLIFTIIFFFSGCNSDDSDDKTSVVTKTENLVDETVSEDSDDSGVTDVNGSFISSSDTNTTLNTTQEDNTTQTVATDTNATQTTTTDTNSTTLITDTNTTTPRVVVINGHTLPPEPDPTINDSTLLGIDSNNNGVRDDVEIWIYETYKDKHPIHIDIAMQAGRGYKKVLETPERAREITDEVDSAMICTWYYRTGAKYFNESLLISKNERIMSKYFTEKIYFNTEERYDTYEYYDSLLSGGVYALPKPNKRKSYCDFNTSKYEE